LCVPDPGWLSKGDGSGERDEKMETGEIAEKVERNLYGTLVRTIIEQFTGRRSVCSD